MTAKLMSRSVCFEPISKSCFVSGHDFRVCGKMNGFCGNEIKGVLQGLKSLRENWDYEISPEGTAELSPGRQSWV